MPIINALFLNLFPLEKKKIKLKMEEINIRTKGKINKRKNTSTITEPAKDSSKSILEQLLNN